MPRIISQFTPDELKKIETVQVRLQNLLDLNKRGDLTDAYLKETGYHIAKELHQAGITASYPAEKPQTGFRDRGM